MQLQTLS